MVDPEQKKKEEEELESFLQTLSSELSRVQKQNSYTDISGAFVHWCIRQLCPNLKEKEIIHAVRPSGPGDKGIDAAWFDKEYRDPNTGYTGVYFIVQGKSSTDFTKVKTHSDQTIKDLSSAYSWLNESGPVPKKPELEAVRKEFNFHANEECGPVKFIGFVAGRPSPSLSEGFKIKKREHRGANVQFELYDLNRLHGLYLTRLETDELPPPENIKFSIINNRSVKKSPLAKAIVAEVPLNEIHRMVEEHGLSLFGRNLRVPIVNSRYNEGIRRVINNDDEINKFWYYNNGITAICDNFLVKAEDDDPEDRTTVTVKRMQIVNGCQTCYAIYDVGYDWSIKKKPLDPLASTTVLFRLINVGSDERKSSELGQKIAKFTNSQTPITPRDLRATDPEQGRLKKKFSQQWGYFLEVKKGEWSRRLMQDRSMRTKYENPFNFDNEKAGQSFVSLWMNNPTLAKGGKKRIFENESIYDSIYGFNVPVEGLLFSAQMLYLLDSWRRKRDYKYRSKKGSTSALLSREKVLRHGNFYVLSIIGSSIQKRWKVEKPADIDDNRLEVACENLKDLIPVYMNPPKGRLTHLCRALDNSMDKAISLLFQYSKAELKIDPDIDIRVLLVRTSTWDDFYQNNKGKINKNAIELANLLTNIP